MRSQTIDNFVSITGSSFILFIYFDLPVHLT